MKFRLGMPVMVQSETSEHNQQQGKIIAVCAGKHPDIYRVEFADGSKANLMGHSLVEVGYWLVRHVAGEDPLECSLCGNSVNVFGYKFCPHCGHPMARKGAGKNAHKSVPV